jgi:hypothetical protein
MARQAPWSPPRCPPPRPCRAWRAPAVRTCGAAPSRTGQRPPRRFSGLPA